MNFPDGYRLRYPGEWYGTVTVKKRADTGEWRFVLYSDSLSDSTVELLRIKVTSPADYQDKLETVEYKTIATKGVNSYQVYIPPDNYPGYSITYEDLSSMFSLLP